MTLHKIREVLKRQAELKKVLMEKKQENEVKSQ